MAQSVVGNKEREWDNGHRNKASVVDAVKVRSDKGDHGKEDGVKL